jgi:adenosylmethionine-8-amino-7-oxononanoate aminotransferase
MLERNQITDPAVLRHSVLDFRQMSVFVQQPLIFERGEGVQMWDVNGKRYLDGIAGIFVVAAGHHNRAIIDAMKAQLELLCFTPTLHGTNVPAVELADLLARIAPGDLNTVKLLSSGSEATETAMKLCRQYWKQAGKPGKWKFISRYYGYHGATLGAMAASGTPKRRMPFEPLPAGYIHIPTVHCYRCPYGQSYPTCGVFCAEYLRQVISLEGPDTVAAVIVEPIGNTGGILMPPPEYLPIIRRICDELDVLLIFDEMITGMGRTGRMFAADTFGVTPDVLCLGKGLSSGYAPLAATIWNERIQSAFWGPPDPDIAFGDGHTFSANPLSAAAGIASVNEILSRDLPARARERGAQLKARLDKMGNKFGVFGDVRGVGLLWGVELVKDRATKEAFPAEVAFGHRIGAAALERGLILRHDPHWFALAPALVVTAKELDEMCDVLEASIATAMETL